MEWYLREMEIKVDFLVAVNRGMLLEWHASG